MKKQFKEVFPHVRQLILYAVFGACSAGLDFAIYTALVELTAMPYLAANCISVLAGISTSFMLNRSYNFKVKDHTSRRFVTFLIVGLLGLMLSNAFLYLCIDVQGMDKVVAKLLSIVLVAGLQFLINKYVTFKPAKLS